MSEFQESTVAKSPAIARPVVLCVDDKPANLHALRAILDESDVDLVCAESGKEALSLNLHHQFAVVLLDVQMPEMDGFETAELLHMRKESRNLPIIFVTANAAQREQIETGYQSGAVDYITKPLRPAILRAKVQVFADLFRHRAALEQALAKITETEKELRRSNAALNNFARVAAHDLKQPLNTIVGFASVISSIYNDVLDDEGRRHVGYIRESGMRMAKLIEGLLAYAQLDAPDFCIESTDLAALVDDVKTDLTALIETKGARIDASGLFAIDADPLQMRQVFTNLIGNSLKYTRDGVPPEIQITAKRTRLSHTDDREAIAITFRDNGTGFSKAQADQIFDPFCRLACHSQIDGTGLGLSIVVRVVKCHGGAISASGEPGVGAVFRCILPVRND